MRSGWPVNTEDAGDELAQRETQMAPKAAFQARVILRSAEKVAHQLPEYRAAPEKLHHARGHRRPQERAAIETAHDARGKFDLRREPTLHPRRTFFWPAFSNPPSQHFAAAHS